MNSQNDNMIKEIIFTFLRQLTDRNPPRRVLQSKNVILSPADGKIIYIKKKNSKLLYNGKPIDVGGFISEENLSEYQYAIAIYMSPFDVHINRSPIDGVVNEMVYVKGALFRTSSHNSELMNEKNIIAINNKKFRITIIQIAARFFGKIICNAKVGDKVHAGQQLGIITLGSQVNILIPKIKGLKLEVGEGKRVYAGITKLASF